LPGHAAGSTLIETRCNKGNSGSRASGRPVTPKSLGDRSDPAYTGRPVIRRLCAQGLVCVFSTNYPWSWW
jgi:hypothetical protein